MIKMSLMTLAAIYLVLVVLGRDTAEDKLAAVAVPEPVKQVTLAEPEKLAATPVAAQGGATVIPVRLAPMPGPSLKPSPEHAPLPVAAPGQGALFSVTATSANVREGPSTAQGVVGRVTRGEEVLVLADPGTGWVKIAIEGDGLSGWISKKLLAPVR